MENSSTEEQKPRMGRPPLPDRDKVASSHIHLRASRKRKAHYVRFANKTGETLAALCFRAIDKLTDYPGD